MEKESKVEKGKLTFHDVDQRSEEWLALRVGRVGGSDAISLTTDARMKTQIYKAVSEILTGEEEDFFTSQAMQEGIEKEPIAIEEYEKQTFLTVRSIGYVTNSKYKLLGLSPDGLVGSVGAIEVKCPLPKQHIKAIADDDVPTENKPQVAHYFVVNEDLEWVDFISFCPKVKAMPLFIKRCTRESFKVEIAKQIVGYYKFEVKTVKMLDIFKKK